MDRGETGRGTVLRIKGAHFFVEALSQEVRCSLRGRFRLDGTGADVIPAVGDVVLFRSDGVRDTDGLRGLIVGIEPRKSILARTDPSQKSGYRILGANMDQAILVFAVRGPDLNLRLLDRVLVAAACGPMDAVICINKMDLVSGPAEVEGALVPYVKMGYRVVLTSAIRGDGIDELSATIAGKTSILAGPSGAGKTSLVSRIQPGLELAISDVNASTGRGVHTTTHFELHRLVSGGYLGDTPGVREFGVWNVSKERLAGMFRDFAPFRLDCRFATCTHSHEPDCAVKNAVEEKLISRERYDSYIRILDTLPDERSMNNSPSERGSPRRRDGAGRKR
ncbi:MAG: ribosome small subunit-dependent GTPase A [Candidatus Krumholzibacteria bacterium]|nr:ribosome small subunit-dependent GTPase A [Candidatus Krumholzibacteria bacterium]